MFIVVVRFAVKPGSEDAFEAAVCKNAAASRQEPRCHQFDVCVSEDRRTYFLYEVYDDKESWNVHHHGTPHFKEFSAALGAWVEHKELQLYERVSP